MAQLVATRLDPRGSGRLVRTVQRSAQFPEVLAGMVEVEHLGRPGPAVLSHVPNPRRPIPHYQLGLSPPQSFAQGLPVKAAPQFHWIALPTNHHLLAEHAPPTGSPAGLFMPIVHTSLPFVPFHAGLLGFLLPPARTALAHHPPVDHQDRQRRGRLLGLAFFGKGFPSGLQVGFGPGSQSLGQGVQRGVLHLHTPFARYRRGLFIRVGSGHREGQLVFQPQAQLLVTR